MGSVTYVILPRGFSYTGDLTVSGEFTEANTADSEEAHESMAASAEFTTVVDTCWKLRLSACRFIAEVFVEPFFLLMLDGRSSH